MKIAFHIYSLEHGGGAERVVSNLANQFYKAGYEVFVTTQCQAEMEYPLQEGVKRVHLGLTKEDENKSKVLRYLSRIKHVKEFVLKEKPDVLIAFEKTCIVRCLMATNGKYCKVIGCVRTNPELNYDGKLDQLLVKYLFRKAAGFVFQTVGQRDYFPKKSILKSTIILNPLHEKYIGVTKADKRKQEVVQSGRITPAKDHDTMVDAFVKVHEKHPDYVLKLYGRDTGDGTFQHLLQKIKEVSATEYIFPMGASDTLEKDLKEASVFAFSSAWEGLPNALMEAMALKLPVVATDCPCGGPATLIESGKNGLLVPIKNPEKLAEGICYMIEHPVEAEKMADEAGKIVESANASVVLKQWIAFVNEIVQD